MPYVSNISSPTGTGAQSTTGKDTKPSNEVDKDMFLRLLVTQLKYQDPLNPTSPDQFLAQTAQFTSVEKLTQLAADSAKSTLGLQMSTAASLIGKAVTYAAEGGADLTATVRSARIDDQGEIVLTIDGDKELTLIEVKAIGQGGTTAAATAAAGVGTTTVIKARDAASSAGSTTTPTTPTGGASS